MASYGILGFMSGAGEAGGKFAEEAKQNQYREAAAERLEHNEQTRLRIMAALEQKQAERDRNWSQEDTAAARSQHIEDRDLVREDALLAQMGQDATARQAAQTEAERYDTDFERKKELIRMQKVDKPTSYSEIKSAKNEATGKVEQYRLNNDSGKVEWLGIEAATDPLQAAKIRKADADAVVSEGKVKELDAKAEKAKVIQGNAVTIIDRLLKDEGSLSAITGVYDSSFLSPTVRQSSKDAENDLKSLRSILTMDNLDAMTGVLSESDIAMLKEVSAAGLDQSNNTEKVKEALQMIRARLSPAQGSGASGGWGGGAKQKAPSIGLERQSELSSKYDI